MPRPEEAPIANSAPNLKAYGPAVANVLLSRPNNRNAPMIGFRSSDRGLTSQECCLFFVGGREFFGKICRAPRPAAINIAVSNQIIPSTFGGPVSAPRNRSSRRSPDMGGYQRQLESLCCPAAIGFRSDRGKRILGVMRNKLRMGFPLPPPPRPRERSYTGSRQRKTADFFTSTAIFGHQFLQ